METSKAEVSEIKKILLVEDDAFLELLISKKMSAHGLHVLKAAEGGSALALAEKEQPNLILLDILLPGMSGFEILEKLKSKDSTKAIPVIVLSNLSQHDDIEKAYKLGAINFYVKSNTSPGEITERIEAIFNKS